MKREPVQADFEPLEARNKAEAAFWLEWRDLFQGHFGASGDRMAGNEITERPVEF